MYFPFHSLQTVHARQKLLTGEFVPLSKAEEVDTVTWFTTENVKNLKTYGFTPEEDRIILQAQLYV